jgi:hypothetical protein
MLRVKSITPQEEEYYPRPPARVGEDSTPLGGVFFTLWRKNSEGVILYP